VKFGEDVGFGVSWSTVSLLEAKKRNMAKGYCRVAGLL